MPPKVSWPSLAATMRSANIIIPAHEPYVGIPESMRFLMGLNTSNVLAKETIVVDSPPGIMRASTLSNSWGVRTSRPCTPQCAKAFKCSRKSPCKAKTPTCKFFTTNHVQISGVALEDQQR